MIAAELPSGWKCEPDQAKLFAELERRFRPEIASRARKAQAMGVAEFDDAVQEARLTLLNVVARFNPERGDLEHYVRRALRNALASSIRAAKIRKAHAATLQPIHEPVENETPESAFLDRDFIRRLVARSQECNERESTAEKCNERELSILALSFEGFRRSEICRRLGLSRKQVDYTAERLSRRFEKFKTEVVCHG